jgi:cobalt/nickel transport system permease protein
VAAATHAPALSVTLLLEAQSPGYAMNKSAALDRSIREFQRLDLLAEADSAVHRLDSRAKVLAAVAFILAVVSMDRYSITALVPYFAYPAALVAAAALPAGLIVRRSLLVVPFALAVGILNPLFDREIVLTIGSVAVSGGWLSFASIVLRAVLAAAAAIILVATTGFPAICGALERFGLPRAFVVQLLFLYRYLVLLGEETGRLVRARELRAFGRPLGLAGFGTLAGHLLIRTWQRAERVYMAMLARGFTGAFPAQRSQRFGGSDWLFVAVCLGLFAALRFGDLPARLGLWALRSAP